MIPKYTNGGAARYKRNGAADSGQVYWSSASPYPFSEDPGLLSQDDYLRLVNRHIKPDARIFDLSDEKQLAAYLDVIEQVTNGWYQLYFRKHMIDEASSKVSVYVEWGVPHSIVSRGGTEEAG